MTSLLIVTTVPATLEAFLLPFARHFAARGWRVDAMARGAADHPACRDGFDRVWDVPWARNPLDPRNLLAAPRTVRTIVARESYDLVHVHTPVAAAVTRFALRPNRERCGPRILYTAHGLHFYRGGPPLRNAAFLALEKFAGRWTDFLIVMNEEDRMAARRHGLVPPDRLVHLPGIGVDPARYAPACVTAADVVTVRDELGVAPGTPLFLSIGELIPRKRHQDALTALARMTRQDAHLAIAGVGPEGPRLRALATALGIADRVHFLGHRADIPALIRSAAAVVLVSGQEGLPRCLLEAMSLQAPIIGSDIRGIRDLLGHGSGHLVAVGDINGLAAAMTWLLDHPEAAQAMASRGRQAIETGGFDEAAILAAHEALYARALALGRARTVP